MFTSFLQSSHKLVMVDGSGMFNYLSFSVSLLCYYIICALRAGELRDLKEGSECNGVIH